MPELTPAQIAILARLIASGFSPAIFPLYANAIGIRRGPFAALLEPAEGGGLQLAAKPCYTVEGNLSVCIEQDGRRWFVWKSKRVEATAELLAELERFSNELAEILLSMGTTGGLNDLHER